MQKYFKRLRSLFLTFKRICGKFLFHLNLQSHKTLFLPWFRILSQASNLIGSYTEFFSSLTNEFSVSCIHFARGRKGGWFFKGNWQWKGVVVGRFMSTQIPTSIPMKPIMSTTTTSTSTTNVPQLNVDSSNLQKKGISIVEGWSNYVVFKLTVTINP